MSIFNPFAFGFVCVAAVFTVGADYVVQSKAAGYSPGEYALADYLDSYGLRYSETIANRDKARRQAEPARTHLPEVPQGWERREWDLSAVDLDSILDDMSLIQQMAAKAEMKLARKAAKYDVWEYVRGDETIRLLARFTPPDADTKTAGPIADLLTGTFERIDDPQHHGYAIVQGVPFFQVTDADGAETDQLMLEASLGDSVTLAVASDTSPKALRAVLEQIDFDNLNLMLDAPLAGVGSAAPELSPAQEQALAQLYTRARNEGESLMALFDMGFFSEAETSVFDGALAALIAAPAPEAASSSSAQGVKRVATSDSKGVFGDQSNRLQLSGGRSCLGDSGGRLCN